MLTGNAASAGVVVSKVYKLEHPKFTIERKEGLNVEEEVAKLQTALEQTRADITLIQTKAQGKLSEEELAIFDAHLMVTNDPEFIGQIEEIIKNESVNAEYAVEFVGNMFVGMFESMDDAYFRERAADIKDVTYRIKCHVLNVVIPDLSLITEEVVIVAEDLSPSDTAQLDVKYTKGFATQTGGKTSHSAIMARSLEIPAIVGVGEIMSKVNHGDEMILDALEGVVIINPTDAQKAEYNKKAEAFLSMKEGLKVLKDAPSVTTDGHHVEVCCNIGTPKDIEGVIANGGEGVGLYRTEFLYMDAQELPTEDQQFEAYKTVLEAVPEYLVVVRTLDIGGDKKLPYLPIPEEMNPFLGYRAIRLCLDRTDIFRTQLRALIRASAFGKLGIMFPMIATLDEYHQAKSIFNEEKENLIKEGHKVSDTIQVGMMVEIPAAAVMADQFAKVCDFFSIGTNDLIQYGMAADRMSEKVSYLYQPLNPANLRLIKMSIDGAHKEGIWCGMCGEMAADELAVPVLLGLGLDEFSMSANAVLQSRKMIRELSKAEMEEMANKALNCATTEEVETLVKSYIYKK